MRIEKQFAPFIINIDSLEDRKFILEVLERARNDYLNKRGFFNRSSISESFPQKCDYIIEKLK